MVKILIEKARELRKRINANLQATRKLIRIDELSEDELLNIIDLYESFEAGKLYKEDEIFKYENKLYKINSKNTQVKKIGYQMNYLLYILT